MFRLVLSTLLVLAGLAGFTVGKAIFPVDELIKRAASTRQEGIQYRLPNDTFPLHYKVHLNTRVDKEDFDFTGEVRIDIGVAVATNKITIHALQLTPETVTLYKQGTPATEIPIQAVNQETTTDFLTITTVSEQLLTTEKYSLDISFKGQLRNDEAGFYRAWYTAEDGTRRYLATTQFESTDARHAFPCYDEPQLRSTFDISITHGASYHAVSNMPIKATIPIGNDGELVTTAFETTVSMSTYLLAFVVSDYTYLENANAKPLQRVYSQPPKLQDSHFALEAGVRVMNSLESYLNVDYSLEKIDQFGIPQFAAGAMENWGLVTYREPLFHWNAETFRTSDQLNVVSVIAHEYAHQWFGNLVSPKWWTYLWLNEGFATLYEHEAVEMAYPEMRFGEMFNVYVIQAVFAVDSSDNTRPMTHYAESPNGISALFDRVAYPKSGSVLNMIKHFMTEPVWKKGLEKYLTEMSFKPAEPQDLYAGLQAAVSEASVPMPTTMKEILDSWTTQRGYPLVSAHRMKGGDIHFTQSRFMDAVKEDPEKIVYYVPVNFASKSNPNFGQTTADFWFNTLEKHYTPAENEAQAVADSDWILVNKKQAYYYRVNYDDDNWMLLANELTDGDMGKIHLLSRAQLLDDALDLARFNHLDYNVALHIVKYLKKETDYIPWRAANVGLTELNRLLRDSDSSGYLKTFLHEISEPLYKAYGVSKKATDDHAARLNRVIALNWACISGVESCLKDTLAVMETVVAEGTVLDPDLRDAIYCHGMRSAGAELFNTFLGQAKTAADSTTRSRILTALGCNENEEIQNAALVEIIANAGTAFTPAEQRTFINSMLTNSATGYHTVLHVASSESTSDSIKTIYSTSYASLLTSLANFATTAHFKEDIEVLLNKYSDISASTRTTVANRIADNLAFVAENEKEVANFLTTYYKGAAASVVASLSMVLIAAITSYSMF